MCQLNRTVTNGKVASNCLRVTSSGIAKAIRSEPIKPDPLVLTTYQFKVSRIICLNVVREPVSAVYAEVGLKMTSKFVTG